MSGCNAELTVSDTTLPCRYHDDLAAFPHGGVFIRWHDSAPGAKPHTPPRYRAYPMHPDEDGNPDERHCGWLVQFADGDWWKEVASFPVRHPDPAGAAEAEAARLNGEDKFGEHIRKLEERVDELEGREAEWSEWAGARLNERDRARRERDRVRGSFHRSMNREIALLNQREEARAERDAFRAALEDIARGSWNVTRGRHVSVLEFAREVLEGVR